MSDFLFPEHALAGLDIETIDALIRKVAARRGPDISDKARLATSIKRQFKHDLIRRFGDREILDRIGQAIRLIRGDLNHMLPDVVPPDLASEIGLHNDVAVVTNAARLMSFVRVKEGAKDSQIEEEDLRSKHARIMLTLGVLGFLIEAVDEAEWSEDDLLELTHAVRYGAKLRNVRVVAAIEHVAEIQPGEGSVKVAVLAKDSVRVFLDDKDAEAYAQTIPNPRYSVSYIDRLCREARVGDEVFYVYTNARRKALFPMAVKILRSVHEPEGFLRDGRGVRDEVVAVRSADGAVRVPTREDAIVWAGEVSKQIFSLTDIRPETAQQKKARHGGLDYWDYKIHGRIVRDHDGYRIGGRFEWIVQPLVDSLYAQLSVVEEHHDVYAMRRLWLDMLPLIAPHRKWGKPQDKENTVSQELVDEFLRAKARWLRIVRARLSI